jgi:hypothetical protein
MSLQRIQVVNRNWAKYWLWYLSWLEQPAFLNLHRLWFLLIYRDSHRKQPTLTSISYFKENTWELERSRWILLRMEHIRAMQLNGKMSGTAPWNPLCQGIIEEAWNLHRPAQIFNNPKFLRVMVLRPLHNAWEELFHSLQQYSLWQKLKRNRLILTLFKNKVLVIKN